MCSQLFLCIYWLRLEVMKACIINGVKSFGIDINIITVPSGPPKDVSLMDTDPAMLSVRFRPPEASQRNGDVTGYVIRYTRVSSGVSQMITVEETSSISNGKFWTSVIPGLVAFTHYSVEVAAVNVNGTGPFSDAVIGLSGQDGK